MDVAYSTSKLYMLDLLVNTLSKSNYSFPSWVEQRFGAFPCLFFWSALGCSDLMHGVHLQRFRCADFVFFHCITVFMIWSAVMAAVRGRGLKKMRSCQSDFILIYLGHLSSEMLEILNRATFKVIYMR